MPKDRVNGPFNILKASRSYSRPLFHTNVCCCLHLDTIAAIFDCGFGESFYACICSNILLFLQIMAQGFCSKISALAHKVFKGGSLRLVSRHPSGLVEYNSSRSWFRKLSGFRPRVMDNTLDAAGKTTPKLVVSYFTFLFYAYIQSILLLFLFCRI